MLPATWRRSIASAGAEEAHAGLFFRVYGQAGRQAHPPLVLIHGAGGNLGHWPPQVRRLPGAQVYALDLPGHGATGGDGYSSVEAYAAAVARWLEAEALPPACVVGHSLGGAIAQVLARRQPARVAALGLVATGAQLPIGPELLAQLQYAPAAALEQFADLVYGPSVDVSQRVGYQRQLLRLPALLLWRDLTACAAFDGRAALPRLTMPALVVGGADDRMVAPALTAYLADHLQASERHELAATGHMIMLERPARLAELLHEFIIKL